MLVCPVTTKSLHINGAVPQVHGDCSNGGVVHVGHTTAAPGQLIAVTSYSVTIAVSQISPSAMQLHEILHLRVTSQTETE